MPSLVDRPAQRYVAERDVLSILEFPRLADRLPGMIGTLIAAGVELAGAPFFRYRVIHPGMRFTVEAGVPIAGDFAAAEPMFVDELPAGKYVTSTYVGAPDGLAGATTDVLAWGATEDVRWDNRTVADGEEWACRLEVLLTNPLEQPDSSQWVTELLFKLAD